MERVTGIGGLFFKSQDPKSLGIWYEEHLGINVVPQSYGEPSWLQEAGPTVFAPFAADTDYFGRESQTWMVNFRVANLEAMVSQLRDSGIAVEVDAEDYPNGKFARLDDPEGNPIQLWEPKD